MVGQRHSLLKARGRSIQCIDTDPVNTDVRQYSGIDATRLELMRDGSIDVRGFDGLMERLLTEDGTFVIDNGASTFIPLGATSWRTRSSRFCGRPETALRPYGHHRYPSNAQHECGGRSIHPPRPQRGTEVLLASLSVLDRVCAIHGRSPENLRSRALWRSWFLIRDSSIPGHHPVRHSPCFDLAYRASPKAAACFHSLRAKCACIISGQN